MHQLTTFDQNLGTAAVALVAAVASLAPCPAAELVPTVWVALAVAAGVMLTPYVILDKECYAALVAAVCAFVMAGIAWRIASAPRKLMGIIGCFCHPVLHVSGSPIEIDNVSDLFLSVDPDLAPFQQIMDQFRNLIERGELRAGDTLPTVRQLASDLSVAPNTVARAYAELQEDGLLISDGRRGTRVAAGVRSGDKTTRARKLHETIAQLLQTLAHCGYSESEITNALRRFAK